VTKWLRGWLVMGCVSAAGMMGQSGPAREGVATQKPTPALGESGITAPAASALQSPGAEYKDATHPLEVVRQSLENWGDAELSALSVGMKRARESCQARTAEAYSGDDLYELAHLCSFGQDWNDANTAATRYIDSKAEPWRAQAYALSINAMVHLNGTDLAVQTAETMLRVLPYDAEVAYAVRYLKDYLEQAGNPQAVTLAEAEHIAIIQALKVGTALKATHGDAVMSLGLLYDSAMELAFFHKFAGRDEYASQAAADCDDSLKKVLIAPDDMRRIESVRVQFATVGISLPQFTVLKALESPAAKAAIEGDLGEGTVLVLFPDWCAQCRGMMKTMTQFARVNAGTPLHAYGLMFTEDGDETGGTERAALYKDLAGTQTFVVPAETAKEMGALDYPTAVAVDNRGVVRFIGMIPTDAFNGGGYMEKVFMRMAVGEGREMEREQGSRE